MAALRGHFPETDYESVTISTEGDRVLDRALPLMGGKGVFTAELETALYEGKIDAAVHSLKDLPTEMPKGLRIGAILERANAADVLVTRDGVGLSALGMGSVVGTSSRRRAAQLLHQRPDLEIADIRGNVETRIGKVYDSGGVYDATLLAYAGLARLGRLDVASEVLDFDFMLPAAGQGALAVQCRDDGELLEFLDAIHHAQTAAAVKAERAFLGALGGGCAVPIGAYGVIVGGQLRLRGRVTAMDGGQQIDVAGHVEIDVNGGMAVEIARTLGRDVAQEAIHRGAGAILDGLDEG
jgi:hydroxymethylbilane synthase